MMIKLYGFGPFQELPDASSFVMKVDLYLRAAKLEYEFIGDFNNLRKAPKGKLPFIDDEGTIVTDSCFIFDYLKASYGDPLDQDLNPEQQAIARAFMKMMDENLYWCMVHARWMTDRTWPTIRQAFFGAAPFPLKQILPVVARRGVAKSLFAHGLGRHSDAEILHIARSDLDALSNLLGNKDYFLINKMTTLDVTAYGVLCQLIIPTIDCELNDVARSYDNLLAFVERVRERYYA